MTDPTTAEAPRPRRLELTGSLDIGRATDLQASLLDALSQAHVLEIDVSCVERADTAGLQLLLAFTRSARERGTPIRWSEPARCLAESAERLGLTSALGWSIGRDS